MWRFKELLVYLEYNRENKNETNTNNRKHIQRNRNKDANERTLAIPSIPFEA